MGNIQLGLTVLRSLAKAMTYKRCQQSYTWHVHLVRYGNNELIFCNNSQTSVSKLCQTTLADCSELELSSWDQVFHSAGFLSTIQDPRKSSGQSFLRCRLLVLLLLFSRSGIPAGFAGSVVMLGEDSSMPCTSSTSVLGRTFLH